MLPVGAGDAEPTRTAAHGPIIIESPTTHGTGQTLRLDVAGLGIRHIARKMGDSNDTVTSGPSLRALAARARAEKRWYVYLILCRSGAIYTGIAQNVAVRYAQHAAGIGARYTRANPPRRLLLKIACRNQSEASQLEAAIKKLDALDKRKLVGRGGATVRRVLLG